MGVYRLRTKTESLVAGLKLQARVILVLDPILQRIHDLLIEFRRRASGGVIEIKNRHVGSLQIYAYVNSFAGHLRPSALAAFGRILARTAREAAQAGNLPRHLQQDLSRSRALVADVERGLHEFAQAALASWESRVD